MDRWEVSGYPENKWVLVFRPGLGITIARHTEEGWEDILLHPISEVAVKRWMYLPEPPLDILEMYDRLDELKWVESQRDLTQAEIDDRNYYIRAIQEAESR